MGSRVVPKMEGSSTSPASYHITAAKNSTMKSSPSASFKGRTFITNPMHDVPGPGMYNAEVSRVRKSTPSYSLGGRAKVVTKSDAPGPGIHSNPKLFIEIGAYNSPVKSSKSPPAYSIGGKSPSKQTNEVPGPGSYKMETSKTGKQPPSFSMSGRLPNKVHTFQLLIMNAEYFQLARTRIISASCIQEIFTIIFDGYKITTESWQ